MSIAKEFLVGSDIRTVVGCCSTSVYVDIIS